MSEQLQSLLDRIQQDGVEKAESASSDIVSKAEAKAASLISDAETKAAAMISNAEKEAALYEERSTKALEQAARDIILTVGDAIGKTLDGIVAQEVKDALDPTLLKEMLTKIVDQYSKDSGSTEIALSDDDKKQLEDFFTGQLAEALKNGVTIRSDSAILAGFEVSQKDKNMSHDFSDEAIAESLCKLVRPRLAEVLRSAVAKKD